MPTIYDDLIPKKEAAIAERKDSFGARAARFFLPPPFDKKFAAPPKQAPQEPAAPAPRAATIYDDLVPGYKKPEAAQPPAQATTTIPRSPLIGGTVPALADPQKTSGSILTQGKPQKPPSILRRIGEGLGLVKDKKDEIAGAQADFAVYKIINDRYYEDLGKQIGLDTQLPKVLSEQGKRDRLVGDVRSRINELSEQFGIPKEQITLEQVRENLPALTRELGIRGVPTTHEIASGIMTLPIVFGLVANPISAGAGLAVWTAMGEVENYIVQKRRQRPYIFGEGHTFGELLPEDATDASRDLVDILSFFGKAKALHVAYKKSPELIEAFTKKTTETYNLPRTVFIESEKIRSIFQTGEKISPEELKLVTDLGLTGEQYKAAIKDGVSIEVPLEKIVTITDRPYWAKLKSFLRLEPTKPETSLFTQEKPKTAPRGLLMEGRPVVEPPAPKAPQQEPPRVPAPTPRPPVAPQPRQTAPRQAVAPAAGTVDLKPKAPAYKRVLKSGYIRIDDAWGNEFVQIRGEVPGVIEERGVRPHEGNPKIDQTLDYFSKEAVNEATPVQIGKEAKTYGSQAELVRFVTSDGIEIFVNKEYLNLALRQYPDAKFFGSGAEKPLALKIGDQTVAVVMPVKNGKIEAPAAEAPKETIYDDLIPKAKEEPVAPERTAELKKNIAENEAGLREAYSAHPDAQNQLEGIFAELDASTPGMRIFIRSEVSPDEVKGIQSTFPKWISEENRSTKLFTAVLGGLRDINAISYPAGRKVRQRELYNEVLDELDKRLGVSTRDIRRGIIDAYDELSQKTETSAVAEPGARRGAGGGEFRKPTAGERKRFDSAIEGVRRDIAEDPDRSPAAIVFGRGFTFTDDINALYRYAESIGDKDFVKILRDAKLAPDQKFGAEKAPGISEIIDTEEIPPQFKERATEDWDENYAEKYGELDRRYRELQRIGKERRLSPAEVKEIEGLELEQAKVENGFVEKWEKIIEGGGKKSTTAEPLEPSRQLAEEDAKLGRRSEPPIRQRSDKRRADALDAYFRANQKLGESPITPSSQGDTAQNQGRSKSVEWGKLDPNKSNISELQLSPSSKEYLKENPDANAFLADISSYASDNTNPDLLAGSTLVLGEDMAGYHGASPASAEFMAGGIKADANRELHLAIGGGGRDAGASYGFARGEDAIEGVGGKGGILYEIKIKSGAKLYAPSPDENESLAAGFNFRPVSRMLKKLGYDGMLFTDSPSPFPDEENPVLNSDNFDEVVVFNKNVLEVGDAYQLPAPALGTGTPDLKNLKKISAAQTPDSLAAEALKYKTAEEFVGSQREVFHGSPNPDVVFKEGSIDFTDNIKTAEGFANATDRGGLMAGEAATVKGAYLDIKNPKRITTEAEYERFFDTAFADINQLKKQGYDGVIYKPEAGGDTYYKVFSPSQIKTRPQLTDIWNKAHGLTGTSEAAGIGAFHEGEPIKFGGIDSIKPLEFPELVELAKDLIKTPEVVKRFRKPGKLGVFRGEKGIQLTAALFKKGNEQQLAAALAHEIGHLIDYLPDKTLKRGNLLGRLQTLRKFTDSTFATEDGREIKNTDIRKELLAVSDYWRPWDEETASKSFKQYRHSGTELYADALSVLFNNPGLLEQMAPKFYAEFFAALDAKPEVKSAYFDLQETLSGTREELIARRRAGVRRMFEEADYKALELQKQKIAEKEKQKKELVFRLRTQLVDKNYAVIDRVRELEKKGVVIPDDENPIYFLEERNYVGGLIKAFTEKNFEPVYLETQKAGIDWTDFGEALLYERIIAGDRSELANPRGLSPAAAQELLNDLMARVDQNAVLRKQLDAFRDAVKVVAEEAFDAGLYTPELHEQMRQNPAYATFQVVEHLEDGVTTKVHKQIGTLKDIVNPADATILKTLVTKREIERQRMKKSVFGFLGERFPGEIGDAKEVWTGKGRRPIESKDPNQKLIYYYEAGRLRGKYVSPEVADSINNTSIGYNSAIVELLRSPNRRLFHPLFITLSLGFQINNLFFRDFPRFLKNVPGMTLWRALGKYFEAAAPAKVRAFGAVEKDPAGIFGKISAKAQRPFFGDYKKQQEAAALIRDAEEAKILSVTFNDLILGRQVEDVQIEDILSRVGVGGFQIKSTKWYARPYIAVLNKMKELGDFIETIPKVAGIYEFKGKGTVSGISPADRSTIRRKIGSPDFLAGGTYKPITNELFLFSNAITQGIRSDFEVATSPKTRSGFWWKTAAMNIVPKVLMYGALLGLFGDKARRIMQSASEYDRTQYTIVPLGEDDEGNGTYLRLPQDDSGRFIAGVFWKTLQGIRGDAEAIKSIQQVLDYTGGQFPSVTPLIEALSSTGQFLTGRNPYDFFRGRNVLTDDEFKARDFRTLKKFLGWEFQQLGGGVIWKFYAGEQRPEKQTTGQFILQLPILSNILGRFIKITNYGQVEELRETIGETQRGEARRRLNERDAVNDAVREYQALPEAEQTPGAILGIARDIADELYKDATFKERAERREIIQKKLRLGVVRSGTEPIVDALFSATSNDQKVAALLAEGATRPRGDFTALLRDLVINGVISGEVRAEVTRKLK